MDQIQLTVAEVSRVVLNRPEKRNAMTVEMGTQLAAAVATLNASPLPRVVVLSGNGAGFSAGGDFAFIEQNAGRPAAVNRAEMLRFYRSFLSILDLRVPCIAVLHGVAMGAGLCLAAACDLRIASEDAWLGANFVHVGLHPGMGATLLLPHLVGSARARDLLLTGRTITAQEAKQIGLVDRVTKTGALNAEVQRLAEELCSAAPIALAQSKATLWGPIKARLAQALEREAEMQAEDFLSDDLQEAVDAFRNKRRPVFKGS